MQEKPAALSRGNIPESERLPHLLFAEESQNYIGDFESILSQTRNFNLILAIATQAIESLSRETATAIFTNAANLISFRVSSTDAERLKDEFTTVSRREAKIARFLLAGIREGITCDDLNRRQSSEVKQMTAEAVPQLQESTNSLPFLWSGGFAYSRHGQIGLIYSISFFLSWTY